MAPFLKNWLYTLGFFVNILKGVGRFVRRWETARKIFIMQILFTFVEALGISTLLALGIGAAVNIIGYPFLSQFSQEAYIYPLLITIITRELGPLLTAFIIIARSATAIATEMAGMVISHEIEAYISIGADPIEYLAVPRFLGLTVSLFMLNLFFSIFGLAGSFAVAQFFNPMPVSVYFGNMLNNLTFSDISVSILKSISFGVIISVVAISRGLDVERASTEVPVAGLKAVGASFGWCILLDIIITALYYIII
ncbi:MAG: ABC transporter permease [Treponema sp.]|jgi:phospholipid/cholesterol/gamma-HCH transport system permease protein|nr:ABC transporter permease [Treponema sp.]